MKYNLYTRKNQWPMRLVKIAVVIVVILVLTILAIRRVYDNNLRPLSRQAQAQTVTIKQGLSANQIGSLLYKQHIIRAAWAFNWYVQNQDVRDELQAGTYSLSPSQSVPDIVSQLTHGKISTKLVTILPGQRLDQIKQTLINDGFGEAAVNAALEPGQYENSPALVDKPTGASLEGYLYPDSFQKSANTSPKLIIQESLAEMQQRLTPDIRAAFAREGLSTYQGIVLASIVEQEVSNPNDRTQVAQVFLRRLSIGMPLGSDVTYLYSQHVHDGRYDTTQTIGLPPGPISNVSENSLLAVAHPAGTDWLYFVTGDNGTTYFSHTLEEHQALTQQYCHKLCAQ